MAMSKVEMHQHYSNYHSALARSRTAESEGRYEDTVKEAIAAWPFIDGMMQYAKRQNASTFESIEAIDIVTKYAPILLDYDSLDALEIVLKEQRRIDKNTSESIADAHSRAKRALKNAHRLWTFLETSSCGSEADARQCLDADDNEWRTLLSAWESLAVIRRSSTTSPTIISLEVDFEKVVQAKCMSCGVVAKSAKYRFFDDVRCPKCNTTTNFVMLHQ